MSRCRSDCQCWQNNCQRGEDEEDAGVDQLSFDEAEEEYDSDSGDFDEDEEEVEELHEAVFAQA